MMACCEKGVGAKREGFPDDLEADQANLETSRSILEANRSKPDTPECRPHLAGGQGWQCDPSPCLDMANSETPGAAQVSLVDEPRQSRARTGG
jgi:hypothetical protein